MITVIIMITGTDALGFIGGVILSICLLPQLIKMFRKKSAKEISLSFTLLFFTGLLLSALYMTLIKAYAGAIPIWVETFFSMILMMGKIYFDTSAAKQRGDEMEPDEEEGVATASEAISDDQGASP